jgi:hypothetical protein
MPSERYGAYLVPYQQHELIGLLFPAIANTQEEPAHILIIEASLGDKVVVDLMTRWQAEGATSVLVADQRRRLQEAPELPRIVAPHDFEDAMKQALDLFTGNGKTPPRST